MSDIATRLKCALGDTGYTQKELAQMTGLTEVSISRYVNGSRVPKATTLARIADALGVGMGYFFDSVDKDTNVPSTDCISRRQAIDASDKIIERDTSGNNDVVKAMTAWKVYVKHLPSAQPNLQPTCNQLATDCVSRQEALNALWKALYEYEDKMEKQFQESDELDIGDWMGLRIFVQNMSDIDRQTILNLPAAQPEVSRIEQELHGKTPEEQYEFLHWLLLRYALAYTDSRLAVVEWLRGEQDG